MKSPEEIARNASPRPWKYHHDGRRDWIEDQRGTVILENVGHLDGPLIVAVVNEAHACGTSEDAIHEDRLRNAAA
jgi:hypothetical protein